MIDAKHVHKLLECKYDFKHWIKDVISSFNFKDGIDYISYRYDNNGEQIIDNNSHVFRHDYYKMACRARLPRRKNKLEGSDLRSRPRSFRWCGSHSKKYDSRIPVFPVWKKKE